MNDLLVSFLTFLPVILLLILAVIVIIAIPLRRKQGHKPTKEPRK